MIIESTDPDAYWVLSYLETMLLRLRYLVTVAWGRENVVEAYRNQADVVGR